MPGNRRQAGCEPGSRYVVFLLLGFLFYPERVNMRRYSLISGERQCFRSPFEIYRILETSKLQARNWRRALKLLQDLKTAGGKTVGKKL